MNDASILRAAARPATAWKNGGGVTHEVAVYPFGASFETFDWRISIASVRTDGPFSQLPGVERRLAVLEGRLCLQVAGREAVVLGPESPPYALPGDAPTHATLPAGPVTDLNVMTRRGRFRCALIRDAHENTSTIHTGGETTVLIAMSSLRLETLGGTQVLAARDAAMFTGRAALRISPEAAAAIYYLIELTDIRAGSESTSAKTSVTDACKFEERG